MKKLLTEGKESAFMSKELAAICKEAPIDTEIEHYRSGTRDDSALVSLFNRYEMFSYIQKIHLETDGAGQAAPQLILEAVGPDKVVSEPDYDPVRSALSKEKTLDFLAFLGED